VTAPADVVDATTHALENQFGLADRIVDEAALANSVERFREQGITLPTFAQLEDPSTFDHATKVGDADPQGPDARNLWRVHWYNDLAGNRVDVPDHVVLPSSLTGVESPIIVVFGDRFPMITAHKVLAAYACLAPRVVTGQFDPTHHRAIWPSTGNYARGGIAISRIMASRGVAILPEGMSQERFDWLDEWCANPADDVIRTHGTESNVKEIYDACNELRKDPGNFVLNQFSEFGNHLGHYRITGRAFGHVFDTVRGAVRRRGTRPHPRRVHLRHRVGRHDRRRRPAQGGVRRQDRRRRGARVPDDARERLRRAQHPGHRRQAHPADPQRHQHRRRRRHLRQVDRRTRRPLQHRRRPPVPRADQGRARRHRRLARALRVLGDLQRARRDQDRQAARPRPDQAIITVATDGAALYPSERAKLLATRYGNEFTTTDAAEVFGEHLGSVDTDHMIDCTEADRRRIFNLGYYTWVEQQGTPFELFEARRDQAFWKGLRRYVDVWDDMIDDFNARVAG
jgi:cysteine synthase